MNYRHAYHAGNFADVTKHLALVCVLSHLAKKDKPFVVIDTHGGCGLYDLASREAKRTMESEGGIRRLAKLRDAPPLIADYLKLAQAFGDERYAGSPLITAQLLRPQDRLVAVEAHDEEFANLVRVLKPYDRARAIEGDGYERLIALLPPPERRGLVLIDPPYEDDKEFQRAAQTLAQAYRRFATGIYMLWFPIKSIPAADAFCGEALAGGVARALRITIDAGKPPETDKERMHAAGILVVNPPFGFDGEMRAALATAAPRLGSGETPAKFRVDWLAGEGS